MKRTLKVLSVFSAAVLTVAACGGKTGSDAATESSKPAASSTGTAASEPSASGTAATASGSAEATGATPASGDLPLVYGVFATPLEEPWDGAINTALQSAADDQLITYKHVDSLSSSDEMERSLRDIAANEKPVLIVGDAFAAEDAVRAVAADYPDIQFAFGSGGKEVAPNFSVFDNWMQDTGYLSGMLAGGTTKSNTIGVVAAMPIPEVNRIVNGFIAGVAETNPKATVKVSFINSFFDPATAAQAAQAQIDAGADVLFAERDGVIGAAADAGLPSIGMMVDQSDQAPDFVLTSLIWNMRPTIDHLIDNVNSGTITSENLAEYSFLKNGGSSLAPLNTKLVPPELADQINAKTEAIKSGEFTTPINEEAPAGSQTVGG